MNVPFGILAALSLLYLGSILTLAMALNEQGRWAAIRRETRRRWLKLFGILAAIALATQLLTLLAPQF